jgi:catechol-2,3-dioxygenase
MLIRRSAPLLVLVIILTPSVGLSHPKQEKAKIRSIELSRLDHVGINVTNLQNSADWYEKVLSFRVFHKWNTTWMIRRGNMRIGLFLRPSAAKVEDIDNKIAITHFAFLTTAKGFEEAQSKLKKLGIKFDPPEDTGIAHSIFINDPDGYQIEITTYYKQ